MRNVAGASPVSLECFNLFPKYEHPGVDNGPHGGKNPTIYRITLHLKVIERDSGFDNICSHIAARRCNIALIMNVSCMP